MKETVRSLRAYFGIIGIGYALLVAIDIRDFFNTGNLDKLDLLLRLLSGVAFLYAAFALPMLLRTRVKALLRGIDVLRILNVVDILKNSLSPVQILLSIGFTLLLFGYLKRNIARLASAPEVVPGRSLRGWLVLILVLSLGALVLALVSWGVSNRDRWRQAGYSGKTFGQGKTGAECLNEATARLRPAHALSDAKANEEFFAGCLSTATLPPEYCTGVPTRGEISRYVHWAVEICAAQGLAGDGDCGRLVVRIQDRCASKS